MERAAMLTVSEADREEALAEKIRLDPGGGDRPAAKHRANAARLRLHAVALRAAAPRGENEEPGPLKTAVEGAAPSAKSGGTSGPSAIRAAATTAERITLFILPAKDIGSIERRPGNYILDPLDKRSNTPKSVKWIAYQAPNGEKGGAECPTRSTDSTKQREDSHASPASTDEAGPPSKQAAPTAEKVTADGLREMARWFDNPNESPTVALYGKSAGMVLRDLADALLLAERAKGKEQPR